MYQNIQEELLFGRIALRRGFITDTQLSRGNDPQFQATLGARDEAETHDREAPAALREAEATDRQNTHARSAGAIAAGLTDFHGTRTSQFGDVAAQQTTTQTDSRRLLEAVLHEALAPAMVEAA